MSNVSNGFINSVSKINRLSNSEIKCHILICIGIMILLTVCDPVRGPWKCQLVCGTLLDINNFILFYIIALFCLPKYWNKNIIKLLLFLIVSFIYHTFIDYLILSKLIPSMGGKPNFTYLSIEYIFSDAIVQFVKIGGFALTFFISRLSKINQQKINRKQLMQIYKEINLLTSNTSYSVTRKFLIFFYNESKNISTKVTESFSLFSNLLNYTFSLKNDEKISIEKEVQHIINFIGLQKLFNPNTFVKINKDQINPNNYIVPGILLTFVENAFKHGVYNNSWYPIEINMYSDKNIFNFKVENLIRPDKRKNSTSTGLLNVKKRLEYFYHNNYILNTSIIDNKFSIDLLIFEKTSNLTNPNNS